MLPLKNDDPIRACGTLVTMVFPDGTSRSIVRNEKDWKGKWVLNDIGGKTDKVDSNVFDTTVRELYEESNKRLFSADDMDYDEFKGRYEKLLDQNKVHMIYISTSKYLLIHVQIPFNKTCSDHVDIFSDQDISRFGDVETHENIAHEYKWMSKEDFIAEIKNLSQRLRRALFIE